jgi:pimeloyl-ACP methyl ester carboxylesterase
MASLDNLAQGYDARCRSVVAGLRRNRELGAAIVFVSAAVGYGKPDSSHLVFFAVLPLFLLQLFATADEARLFALLRALRSVRGDLPPERIEGLWLVGASLAVRDAYFVLFLCFDSIWLLHDLLLPSPVASFEQYIDRLRIGPLSGTGLLAFTVGFWIVYTILLVYGLFVAREIDVAQVITPRAFSGSGEFPERIPFSASVAMWGGNRFRLNGVHMPGTGGSQPLVLWPGFTQNGHVYDLHTKGGSLGEYLWQRGFDIWIFHPRGTGGSGGRGEPCSLDDVAAFDIPAAIDFVSAHVGGLPLLVGHSMGGIGALLSLMGVEHLPAGSIRLSDALARHRQRSLLGLVVLGSFPDFTFSTESSLQRFVRHGIELHLLGARARIPVQKLLPFLRGIRFLALPVGSRLRRALASETLLQWLTLPLYGLLQLVAQLGFWEFLYHIPNVTPAARRELFFATIDGTFWDVVDQYERTVLRGQMLSRDGRVNYSQHYDRLQLPIAVVGMEFDGLADPQRMRAEMFDRLGSLQKTYIVWKGVGHEDHFMEARFFPMVEEAIRLVAKTEAKPPASTGPGGGQSRGRSNA